MKSSNKILLAVIIGFFICIVVVAIIVRTNIGPIHPLTITSFIKSEVSTSNDSATGQITTKNFSVNDFSELAISGFGHTVIKSGDKPSISISANENALTDIDVVLIDKKLNISLKHRVSWNHSNTPEIVIVTTHPLQKIDISGAMHLEYATINSDSLSLETSGAGYIYLSGKINSLKLDTSGASQIEARDLIANNVDIDTSGASQISVYAKDSLKIDASGMTHISYYGNPKNIIRNTAGMSNITGY